MRILAQQADALLGVLDTATTALGSRLANASKKKNLSKASLAALEIALDGMLTEYRQLLKEISPTPGDLIDPKHEPFLRSMVAYSTIVQLLGHKIGEGVVSNWGSHIFSDADFQLIGFDHLPPNLPAIAVQRILPDQIADLNSALGQVGSVAGPLQGRMRSRISDAFLKICHDLECAKTGWESLDMELKSDTWVMRELGISAAELDAMVKDRKIISVPTWSGQRQFPGYQIQLNSLVHAVEFVCEHAAESLRDWPLAVWMARNVGSSDEYFAEKLGSLGLWKPLWSGPATDRFKGVTRLKGAAPKTPLYRVCKKSLSPFFFSSFDAAAPAAGGRFDLDTSTGKGTLYLAETEFGAWSETLDRRPVLTLRELLSMRMWRLEPDEVRDVGDLTPIPETNTPRRPDTQALAEMARSAGWAGVLAPLRSRPAETGVAIFGKTGPNLPATAGIGLWDALPTEGIEAVSLWEYMQIRQELQNDFPIVLRRFPSEMSLTA